MDLHVPPGGSLVELAYEGVSSKFSCFLILSGPTRPCFSHIATLCQKEQYRHTLKIIGRYLLTRFGRRSKKRNNTKWKRPKTAWKKAWAPTISHFLGVRCHTVDLLMPLHSSLQIIRRAGVSSCPWQPWWSDLSDHLLGENRTTKPTWSGCRESEIMLKVKTCYCANWSEKCSRAIFVIFSGSSI